MTTQKARTRITKKDLEARDQQVKDLQNELAELAEATHAAEESNVELVQACIQAYDDLDNFEVELEQVQASVDKLHARDDAIEYRLGEQVAELYERLCEANVILSAVCGASSVDFAQQLATAVFYEHAPLIKGYGYALDAMSVVNAVHDEVDVSEPFVSDFTEWLTEQTKGRVGWSAGDDPDAPDDPFTAALEMYRSPAEKTCECHDNPDFHACQPQENQ